MYYKSSGEKVYPKSSLLQIFPKYTVIGDSLAAGYVSVDGTTISSETARETKNNWPGFLELRTGRTFTNVSVGNTKAKDWRTTYISTANIDTDCYLVGIGVNDNRYSYAIGTSADIAVNKDNNADSFYGNYDYIIRALQGYNPVAHIFVFTIPASESNAESYNVAIRYIASLYERVHLIDLYSLYESEYTSGFIADNFYNGHYTVEAYNYMSLILEEAISNYIYQNYESFLLSPYS